MKKLIPAYKGTCFLFFVFFAERSPFAAVMSHPFTQQHQDRGEPKAKQAEGLLAGSVGRVYDS